MAIKYPGTIEKEEENKRGNENQVYLINNPF